MQINKMASQLVKPAFEEFCIPTKKFADVIVPRGAENTVAIDLIVQHIQVATHSTQRLNTQLCQWNFKHQILRIYINAVFSC